MKKWEIYEVKHLISEYQKKYTDYKNFINWNNTILFEWEYQLLTHIGAIDKNGILNNYPILTVGDNYQDLDGDLQVIKNKIEDINHDKRIQTRAKISWCPRSYSIWTTIKCEESNQFKADEYAKNINTPPMSAYGIEISDMNF